MLAFYFFMFFKKSNFWASFQIFCNLLKQQFSYQQNSLRRNWMLEQPLAFSGCSTIQFFNSLPSLNTVSEAARGNLLLTVQHLCDIWDAMPLHWSPSACHLNPCLGKQTISLGVTSILSMCLCPPKGRYIYVLESATEH